MKVRRKSGKSKKKLEKEEEVDQSKNNEENDDESLDSVLEEYKKAYDEGRLRRDSVIVTRQRISAILERPVVENSSKYSQDDEESLDPYSRKVSMSPAPPKIIPESVPDPKTTSFRVRLKSKPKSCPAQCKKPNIPCSTTEFQKVRKKRSRKLCNGCNIYSENRRKVVRDVASCMPTQSSKEVSTNTKSMLTTVNCKSTQTCCEATRRLTDPKPRTICRSIGLNPIDEIDGCDRAKLWIVLDELIQEFEKQYEEETKRCSKRKRKRQCFCRVSDIHSKTDRRKQNCTYAFLTMTQPYMQYDTRLPLQNSHIKCANENNNSIRCDQNKNLLKFLSLKQKQITCFRYDLKRDFTLTEDDAQRFEREFCDFLVQNEKR
ncbi:hypothetical protein WA026_011003 [Henosepilachna vigintioctopunctata]|uniref:Uncharacterized protein n=1 Tax=Henosepilachna vigintioctopunctata TaxID=420089 RepID=A0AAW1UWL0_9CUCU